jgi:hypothetical protein
VHRHRLTIAGPKGVAGMSYRNILVERFRRVAEQPVEPRAIDYLEHRNREALRAWRQRQFEYELRKRVQPELRAS